MGTRRAKLLCGRVRMDRSFAAGPAAAGFVLTGLAHPRTERVVAGFDER